MIELEGQNLTGPNIVCISSNEPIVQVFIGFILSLERIFEKGYDY